MTNWEIFKNLDEEQEAKSNQIVRLTHYLRCLTIHTAVIDKVEADDIIAHMATKITEKPNTHAYIISADQDFLQLINEQITVYRPMEKRFYTPNDIKEKFYTNHATAEEHKKALKENNEQYEETLKVSSVYNRLIAYDGSQIHGHNFSSSSEDRLTQVMFFQVLNAPVLLPERFRQTG